MIPEDSRHFFANRVKKIRENTDVQQWRYVATRENPSGGASRILNAARVHSGN